MSAVEDRTVAEGRAARSDQFGPGAWLGGDVHEKLPEIEFAFPGPLRDSLLTAIESGAKTATSSLLLEYELAQEPLPAVGDRGIVVDSDAAPRWVLETTDVSVVRLADVPLDHAFAEERATNPSMTGEVPTRAFGHHRSRDKYLMWTLNSRTKRSSFSNDSR